MSQQSFLPIKDRFLNLTLILFFLLFIKRSFFWLFIFVIVGFLLVYFFRNILSSEVILRYSNLTKLFSDHPDFYREGYRGWIIINSISSFFDKSIFYQIFGVGYEGFGQLMFDNYGKSNSHHNQLVGYLVELGFFGLALNLILFVRIFKKIFNLSKNYSSIFLLFSIPFYTFMLTTGFDHKFFLFLYYN